MQMQRYATIFAALLLLWSGIGARAQTQGGGYNYARPELSAATATAAAGARLAGGAALLPGAYPTAPGIGLQQTPAPTAYGASLFPGQAVNQQTVGYTPSGQATTAFGAPVGTGGGANLQQPLRPSAPATTLTGRGSPFAQPQYNTAPAPIGRPTATGGGGGRLNDDDYNDGDYSAIPGVAGVDYPVYAQVPRTNFDCSQQPLPGYYADIEAQCQVFHICALNRTYSFLCPNGTVFSQETLVCVWWNQYDCVSAPSLYANNAYIYDYSGGSNAQANNINNNNNAYGRTVAGTNYNVSPVAGGALRPTNVPQTSGFQRTYTVPSPPVPTQAQGQFGTVVRPSGTTGNVVTPGAAGRASSSLSTAAAAAAVNLPENAVGTFTQPVVAGPREYLPPANAARRQRSVPV